MATDDEVRELGVERVVYGYVRAEQADEIEIAQWRKEIAQFCDERGYRLHNVFADRNEPDDSVARPALGGLLERLILPEVHGVIVLHLDHLSAGTDTRAVLRRTIQRTGAHVIVIHEEPDDTKADGA